MRTDVRLLSPGSQGAFKGRKNADGFPYNISIFVIIQSEMFAYEIASSHILSKPLTDC